MGQVLRSCNLPNTSPSNCHRAGPWCKDVLILYPVRGARYPAAAPDHAAPRSQMCLDCSWRVQHQVSMWTAWGVSVLQPAHYSISIIQKRG